MTETATAPETQVETPQVEESRLSREDFARRVNTAIRGNAKYDSVSDGSKLKPALTVKVGDAVPVSRKHIAAYCGMSYNAFIAREKSCREAGINLLDLPRGKRGKGADVADINKALAEDAVATEIAKS